MVEQPYRVFLIIIAIYQGLISFSYMKRARAVSTIFQHRDEGALLAMGIAVFAKPKRVGSPSFGLRAVREPVRQ
jgi:hypothetical protein